MLYVALVRRRLNYFLLNNAPLYLLARLGDCPASPPRWGGGGARQRRLLFVQQQRWDLVWLHFDLGDGPSASVTALQLGGPLLADHDLVHGEVRNGLHHRVLVSL